MSCWDDSQDGVCDDAEDVDGDGSCSTADCSNDSTGVSQYSNGSTTIGNTIAVFGTSIVGVSANALYVASEFPAGYTFGTSMAVATEEFAGYEAYKGVDPSQLSAAWGTSAATTEVRFNWDLGAAHVMRGIFLLNEGGTHGIRAFTVYGSNSSSTLTDVVYASTSGLTQLGSGFTAAAGGDAQHFVFANTTAYRYLTLRIADGQGASDYIGFAHVQAVESNPSTAYSLMTPGVDYSVTRAAATGAQSLSITWLNAAPHGIVIDYL